MKLVDHVHSVTCNKKKVTLDGKPYRMEVWGTSFMGALHASVPLYFASFETSNDCERAKTLVLDFLEQYRTLRKKEGKVEEKNGRN